MKSYFAFFRWPLLAALFCACLCSRGEASGTSLSRYLIAESIKLTCAMDSLAESGVHMDLVASHSEMSGLIEECGADVYTVPDKAVLIKIYSETAKSTYEKRLGKLNLPNDVYDMVMRKTYRSVANIINSRQGVNAVAVSSMLALSKSFLLHKDFTGNVYVVLLYDKHCSVTFFSKSGEGVMSASTNFLFLSNDMKKAITDEMLAGFISEKFGISGLETEYIDYENTNLNRTLKEISRERLSEGE